MANKTTKGSGSASGVLAILTIVSNAVAIVAPAIKPLIDDLNDKRDKRAEERKDWIPFPELYLKSNPKKLDDVVAILKNLNLKFVSVAINIKNSNAKYRNCFDMQVVFSGSKHKKLMNPKTDNVQLYYVTSEVIKESKRLFDESEKRKAEIKNERCEKRIEQKQKVKNLLDNTVKLKEKKNPDIDVKEDWDTTNNMKKETWVEETRREVPLAYLLMLFLHAVPEVYGLYGY